MMTISEQIKVLCVRSNISVAELARRIGTTPQNLSGKMKRESFTVAELENIAVAVNSSFERKFILKNGEEI
jgi:transcriptional regulator with XRE-family HTH domain